MGVPRHMPNAVIGTGDHTLGTEGVKFSEHPLLPGRGESIGWRADQDDDCGVLATQLLPVLDAAAEHIAQLLQSDILQGTMAV